MLKEMEVRSADVSPFIQRHSLPRSASRVSISFPFVLVPRARFVLEEPCKLFNLILFSCVGRGILLRTTLGGTGAQLNSHEHF